MKGSPNELGRFRWIPRWIHASYHRTEYPRRLNLGLKQNQPTKLETSTISHPTHSLPSTPPCMEGEFALQTSQPQLLITGLPHWCTTLHRNRGTKGLCGLQNPSWKSSDSIDAQRGWLCPKKGNCPCQPLFHFELCFRGPVLCVANLVHNVIWFRPRPINGLTTPITHNVPLFERLPELAIVWMIDALFVNLSVIMWPTSETCRVERPTKEWRKFGLYRGLYKYRWAVFIHNARCCTKTAFAMPIGWASFAWFLWQSLTGIACALGRMSIHEN